MHREYVSLHKNKDEKMWMVYDGRGMKEIEYEEIIVIGHTVWSCRMYA